MSNTPARLRLDKSRPYSTIHGERQPGDPHQLTAFAQDGIHYDAQGLHLDHLVEDDKTRALVDRRLKRQQKAARPNPDDGDDDGDDANVDQGQQNGDTAVEVKLESWLRGEARYPWFAITKAARDRFHQNITKQVDMIIYLVEDEKIITEDELAPELKQLLPPRQG